MVSHEENMWDKCEVGHYLAVFHSMDVHAYDEKRDAQKGGYACQGVNLYDKEISSCSMGGLINPKRVVVTYPYRPSV
jgi:hypothetical protein